MQARYYEPGVKRFLSVDPAFLDLSFKIEDPQSMNSYAYARNSPIHHVDPDGRDAVLNLGMLAGIQLGKLTAPYVINNPVQALQTGSRFLPYYGDAVDVYESVAGKDVYSGESLSGIERAVTGGLVAAPIVPGIVGRAGVKAVSSAASEAGKIGSDLSSAATKVVKNLNSYSVYQGFDAEGSVRYVGITSRNPFERFSEHLRSLGSGRESLRYSPIDGADNLTRDQARSIEQGVINQFGLQKDGGQLLNKINSIAPRSKSW